MINVEQLPDNATVAQCNHCSSRDKVCKISIMMHPFINVTFLCRFCLNLLKQKIENVMDPLTETK